MLQVNWADRAIQLRADGSVFDAAQSSLWVADLHLGKDASFRTGGVPVPDGPTQATLHRLGEAIVACDAQQVIVVGDMVHSRTSWSPPVIEAWQSWRARFSAVDVLLVEGNHDRRAGATPDAVDVTHVGDRFVQQGVTFCHEPQPVREGFSVCGHVHPAIGISERGGPRLLAACFWLQPTQLMLPAFGAFTGYGRIAPAAGDRVFALVDGAVLEMPEALFAGPRLRQ